MSQSNYEHNDVTREQTAPAAEQTSEHHHSHHHHHHHHSSHRRRKKSKLQKFWQKRKKLLINLSAGVVALLIVLCLLLWNPSHREQTSGQKGETVSSSAETTVPEIVTKTIDIQVPLFEEELVLVSDAVNTCVKADPREDVMALLMPYQELEQRLDIGLPVRISFEVNGLPNHLSIVSSQVEVSEREDFSASRRYSLGADARDVDVYFLKTGTQYYYRITITMSDRSVTVVQRSFKTAESPRVLSLDGVVNVRDVGGWKTADGKTVRQGLLYRGSELDGAVEPSYCATDKAVEQMLTVLGIRTELDLRGSAENPKNIQTLGANVEHTYFGLPMYSELFSAWGDRAIRNLFAELADERNYPAYMHCTYGMDRTGTACFLLGALLGVSEDDLMRDYNLSALYHGRLNSDDMSDFVAAMRTKHGVTMQEKVEGYLLSVGVTEQEIEQIRTIFLQ
ncbi:MAG: tyrosine-protein phosphatase [Oscillospiraceae bacterium]|nr:tyrosine-protein phosphatase [Oscillospiraceae bacterium]